MVSTAVTAVSQPALPPLPVLLEWGVPGSCPPGLSVPEAFTGRIRLGVPPVMKSWEPRSRRAEGSEGSKLLQPCLVQSLAVWRRESHCLHLSVSLQTAQTSSPARGLPPLPPPAVWGSLAACHYCIMAGSRGCSSSPVGRKLL